MDATDVLEIYEALETNNIKIWIDGGWCVDALIEKQTRIHPDLDIAVDKKDANDLYQQFVESGFIKRNTDDTTDWNYVLQDSRGRKVDIHVFAFDKAGNNIYGIKYPYKSLSGLGLIGNKKIRCIAPEWMFKFKTAYPPKDKDLKDVAVLAEKFGYNVPDSHKY